MKRKKTIEHEYKSHLERYYDKHKWYQHLVFLSRVARMILYLFLGISIILFIMNGSKLRTFDNFIYGLVATTIGKIIAIFFGILLIIYGIEKPRG